jgi:hypothetical protein
MECAVCYEAFIIPNNEEECLSIIKEIREKRENYKMLNYLITPKYNTTYKCPTLECKCIICHDCWEKVQISNRSENVMSQIYNDLDNDNNTYHDIPCIYDKFMCPYCRLVDWKEYMSNSVLCELQKKILGEDEYINLLYNKMYMND